MFMSLLQVYFSAETINWLSDNSQFKQATVW